MKYIFSFLMAAVVLGFSQSAHAACLSISANLSQGSSDAVIVGGQVRALQNYLVGAGYLAATPNGYFGPATLAAVKAFQAANGISAIGIVGPATRIALSVRSCSAPAAPISTVSTTQTQTTPTPTASTGSGITVIAPQGGEAFNLDDSYLIRWTAPAGASSNYSIVLEDASGTPMGFITPGVYGNQYTWNVGTVQNASTASIDTVPPGNYRIHVEAAGQGPQSTDVLSRTFTIKSNTSIKQIFPSSVPADGLTSVVLYGSGFRSGALVNIYGYGTVGSQFVSTDGTVVVFTVPQGVYIGSHTITVVNTYGSNQTTTTESTPTSLLITRS